MATHQQAVDAGTRLRDALNRVANDGTFGPARDDFADLHLTVARRLADFSTNPRYGASSPQYDSFDRKARLATGSVGNANPTSQPSIQKALNESEAASDALPAITGGGSVAGRDAGLFSVLRGSLRIAADRPAATVSRGTAGMSTKSLSPTDVVATGVVDRDEQKDPNYYQKLINLFPAEAVSLYGTGTAIFGFASLGVIIVCLIVLVVLRVFATQPEGGGQPQWIPVAVAVVSFLFWATALDPNWLTWAIGRLPPTPTPDQVREHAAQLAEIKKWAAFAGAALVFVAPLLVKPKASA